MNRRLTAILFAASLPLCVAHSADTVGPRCSLEWDPVDDARLIGYRLYVDGALAATVQAPTTAVSCGDLGYSPGQHTTYATAFGNGQESAPSNTLEFIYDPSDMSAPVLRVKVSVEVTM